MFKESHIQKSTNSARAQKLALPLSSNNENQSIIASVCERKHEIYYINNRRLMLGQY